MTTSQTWTIAKVLDWTRSYFESKGLLSPRLDAELLIGHALHASRLELYMDHHRPLSPIELERIRNLVQRRAKFEPVHYILGERDFWSLTLEVNSSVLIPRPDTECLVEHALKLMNTDTKRVLDLCTGSGAIALAVSSERKDIDVIGTDICENAVAMARRNCERLQLPNAKFRVGDLFEGIEGKFELITANPPYIPSRECDDLMPDVRDYEPRLALDGGPDGLKFYRAIISSCGEFLTAKGHLLLEIGHEQGDDLRRLVTEREELSFQAIYADIEGRPRVVHAQRAF